MRWVYRMMGRMPDFSNWSGLLWLYGKSLLGTFLQYSTAGGYSDCRACLYVEIQTPYTESNTALFAILLKFENDAGPRSLFILPTHLVWFVRVMAIWFGFGIVFCPFSEVRLDDWISGPVGAFQLGYWMMSTSICMILYYCKRMNAIKD